MYFRKAVFAMEICSAKIGQSHRVLIRVWAALPEIPALYAATYFGCQHESEVNTNKPTISKPYGCAEF